MQSSSKSILLVDDEPDILDFLSYNLKKEGYKVYCCNNGTDAISIARKILPNLIILDVMMPYPDGYETCREMRKDKQLKDPIIVFLSARGDDSSQVGGFEAGADDYIRKPIKPKVFVSKVRALLRRRSGQPDIGNRLVFDDLVIDQERYSVIYKGQKADLSKKEFELLLLLTTRPGKVFSRDEIFMNVWGSDVIVGERTIDVHIRKIREKIGFDNIRTVKGVGYFFS